jgi:hypothetical protein
VLSSVSQSASSVADLLGASVARNAERSGRSVLLDRLLSSPLERKRRNGAWKAATETLMARREGCQVALATLGGQPSHLVR